MLRVTCLPQGQPVASGGGAKAWVPCSEGPHQLQNPCGLGQGFYGTDITVHLALSQPPHPLTGVLSEALFSKPQSVPGKNPAHHGLLLLSGLSLLPYKTMHFPYYLTLEASVLS